MPDSERSSDNRTVPLVGAQAAYTRVMLERDDARAEVKRLRDALRELRHSAYTTGPGQVKIDRALNAS